MIPNSLPDVIRDLYHRIAEVDRRMAGRKRTGLVTDVDEEKGLVRVALGDDPVDGKPFKTPWLPVHEALGMGNLKASFLPTVGEQVDVNSETGDIADGHVGPSLPTKDNPRPHNKAGEGFILVGEDTSVLLKDGEIAFRVGGTSIVLTKDGIKETTKTLDMTASRINHISGGGGPSRPPRLVAPVLTD